MLIAELSLEALIAWFEEFFFGHLIENVQNFFISLLLSLDAIVYNFIGWAYQVFLVIAQANIFTDTQISEFTGRIYVILGVVMLFIVTYALLRALINPDDFAKGENSFGKLAFNVISALVIIAITPTAFKLMKDFQNIVIQDNVLGQIVLGPSSGDNTAGGGNVITNGGYMLSVETFKSFFYPTPSETNQNLTFEDAAELIKPDESYDNFQGYASNLKVAFEVLVRTGNFRVLQDYVPNAAKTIDDPAMHIDYNWFLSTIAGIFLLYVIISFCIDLGIRTVKLGFYQIIAPIPAMSRIIPGNNKIFSTWISSTLSTYLEVFIRLIIIFFGIYVIQQIGTIITALMGSTSLSGVSFVIVGVARIFILFGIVAFMRQAPKLIGDMFGLKDGGGIKLGIGEKLGMGGGLIAAGMVGAGVTGALRGFNRTKGNVFQKLGAGVRGLGRGVVSGGWQNKGAKSFGDLKSSTGAAIRSVDAAERKREIFRANRPFGGPVGTLAAHVRDKGKAAGRVFGFGENLDALAGEKAVADEFFKWASGKEAIAKNEVQEVENEMKKARSSAEAYTSIDTAAKFEKSYWDARNAGDNHADALIDAMSLNGINHPDSATMSAYENFALSKAAYENELQYTTDRKKHYDYANAVPQLAALLDNNTDYAKKLYDDIASVEKGNAASYTVKDSSGKTVDTVYFKDAVASIRAMDDKTRMANSKMIFDVITRVKGTSKGFVERTTGKEMEQGGAKKEEPKK